MNDALFAVISAAAGLTGAGLGAWATLHASRVVYERANQRDERAWREALRHECVLNIRLGEELATDDPWRFDTRLLGDAFRHPGAFTADELERISWARAHNRSLDERINWDQRAFIGGHRAAALGEISQLEVLLRTEKPADKTPGRRSFLSP
jgi:hypothetical protein